jgi:hypothetical protein
MTISLSPQLSNNAQWLGEIPSVLLRGGNCHILKTRMNDRVLTELEQLIPETTVAEIAASEGRVIPQMGVGHSAVARLISQIQAVEVRPTECTDTRRASGDNPDTLLKRCEYGLMALAGRAS